MNLSLELFKDIRNSGTVLKSLKKYCRNRPHFISNALKYVGGSGSAPDHAGELTTLPPDPLVGRGFAPSALATRYFLTPNILILCAWFPGLRYLNCMVPSSGHSASCVPLYRASLALHWLSALHITMCWLPALNIALHWLPTTRFFISRAPNMLTKLEVELQPLHWLPTLGSRSKHQHQKSKGFLEGFPAGVFSIFKNETPIPIFQTLYLSKRLLLHNTGKELT